MTLESASTINKAIAQDYNWNHVISNHHPLAPNSPFSAAPDLFLHDIITEVLHRYLEIRRDNLGTGYDR